MTDIPPTDAEKQAGDGRYASPPGVEVESPEPSGSRLARVLEQVREISEDVVELVELKLQLVQVQIEERVQGKLNEVISKALVGMLAIGTVVFALVAAAIGLGYLFENQAFGFLAVAALLALLTGIMWYGRFNYVKLSEKEETTNELPELKEIEDGETVAGRLPKESSD